MFSSRGASSPAEASPRGRGEAGPVRKLVLTELEGRFRDACFCCAIERRRGWTILFPPCEGGQILFGTRLEP